VASDRQAADRQAAPDQPAASGVGRPVTGKPGVGKPGAGRQSPTTGGAFERFEELVGTLRESCPWDREQTHASLRRHLLEEAHETLEALDARAALDDSQADAGLDDHLCEELGDLLYQVFFHARVASERGSFSAADVAAAIHDKLVGRHPHVFGGPSEYVVADDSATVLGNWEKLKAAEKGRQSSMDGISAAQPALLYAVKTIERAASAGLELQFDDDSQRTPLDEAARKLSAGGPDGDDAAHSAAGSEAEVALGDLLFAAVLLAQGRELDPEAALRGAVQRFAAEVRAAEAHQHENSGP